MRKKISHALLSFCHSSVSATFQKLESRAVRHVRVACWYCAICWPCPRRIHRGDRTSVRRNMSLNSQTPNVEVFVVFGRSHGNAKVAMSSNRGCGCCIAQMRGVRKTRLCRRNVCLCVVNVLHEVLNVAERFFGYSHSSSVANFHRFFSQFHIP